MQHIEQAVKRRLTAGPTLPIGLGPAFRKGPRPAGKSIDRKGFYIVDCTGAKDKVVSGPFTSKLASQTKAKKYPDTVGGAISHYVTTGQEILDEGISWA